MVDRVDISVSVPTHRLGEFYEEFGQLLQRFEGYSSHLVTSVKGTTRPAMERCEPWRTGTDEELQRDARALYQVLTPRAKRVLKFWMSRNGEPVKAVEMAHALGMASTSTLAGTLTSFTKGGRKVTKRGFPFDWKKAHDGTWYVMDRDIASLFQRALENVTR